MDAAGERAAAGSSPDRPVPVRVLLGGVLALAAAMGVGRFVYTPLLPAMERATHLGTGPAGLLASANYAGYLAGALLFTLVTLGVRRHLTVGVALALVAVTTALMATTTNFSAWSAIRFASGIASAAVFILASDAVLAVLRRTGHASLAGWLYSGVGLGIAASGVIVHMAAGAAGWQQGWIAVAVLAAIIAYPAWSSLSAAFRIGETDRHAEAGAMPPVRTALGLLLAAYTLEGAGYIVTGTFLVAIVDRAPGLSGVGWAVWVVVGLAAVPSTVIWSAASGRLGSAPVLSLVYLTQACGILLPAFAGGAPAAFIAAILFGGTFLAVAALTLSLAARLFPARSAAVIGLLTVGFGVGQIVAPPLAGLTAGPTHDFRPALIAASAAVLLASALTVVLSRQHAARR
ncbi:MAG TPA: YbfB/YjiJ family MFS transporter [Chloroflexota bacterium]|nr:YbfB/YjiJ family MFS transporter [Chloroflexota bacterium]